MVHYGFHNFSGKLSVVCSIFSFHIFCHLKHSTCCNGCRIRIFLFLGTFLKLQIPIWHQITGQMFQKISSHMFKVFYIFCSLCIAICQGCAVYSPCLPSGPCRTVPISLTGRSMVWLSGFHIHKKGMPCRIVFTNDIGNSCMNMFLCNLLIFLISCLLTCPIQ